MVVEGVRVWEKVWVMCEQERRSPAFQEVVGGAGGVCGGSSWGRRGVPSPSCHRRVSVPTSSMCTCQSPNGKIYYFEKHPS